MAVTTTRKIEIINGLRGLAILAIIYHHLPGQYYKDTAYLTDSGFFLYPYTFLSNGWLGVNLFFILSGFVLFLPYMQGKREIGTLRDVWGFYLHRAARLLPLYYFSVFFVVFILLRAAGDPGFMRDFSLMLTVTFNFTRDMWHPSYNAVLWSIGVEVWFSILFPFLIILVNRIGLKRLFVIVLVLSLVVRFAGVWFPIFELTHPSPRFNVMKDSVLGRLDDFLVGMLICYLYVRGIRERGVRAPWLVFLVGLVLLAVSCTLWDYWTHGHITNRYLPFFNNITQAAFFLIMLALLSLKGGFLRAIFTFRPLQVAGLMCYSLYVWHYIAVRVIMGNSFTVGGLVLFAVVLLVASALTYRFIEFRGKDTRALFLLPKKV